MDNQPWRPPSPAPEVDAEAARRTIRRAMWIGLWVWPAFTPLDVYMCTVAYPGAPLWLFLTYRVAIEAVFFAVYRASRRPGADIPRLYWFMNMTYGATALTISLMAMHLGGIRSPYMHGISIVALIRATLVPANWRRALPTFARIALAFPLVMAIGSVVSPGARGEWLSHESLVVFASNYVFVLASCTLGLISGNIVWNSQQQLYRARRIGRYRLQAPIGKGGMGEVWLAWDLTLRRNVALKLLRFEAARNLELLKRFEREAQVASRLRDPHVVQIFDFGASGDGLYYLAMEYLVGLDLAALVQRFGPLPLARAVGFLRQACLALEEAHGAGIIHRDLKPQNLFVTRVGNDPDFLKLLDFGVVRLRNPDPGAEALTWTGLLVGTPAYLAPEVWCGGEADERSDVYSLGVTLYYLLTGVTPFDKWTPDRLKAAAQTPGEGDWAFEVGQSFSAAVQEILRACLARHPEARYQSTRELHDALDSIHDPGAWTLQDAERFWAAADRVRFG